MVDLHRPVMEKEVLKLLVTSPEGVYVDATVGDGGHAGIILGSLAPQGRLVGLDWDREALKRAETRLKHFQDRITLVHESYTNLEAVLLNLNIDMIDGILIDLGASTLQLMDAERGFSYHHEGDLDMRMDRRGSLTAKDIVNHYSEEELTAIFFRYGEERWSKRIAACIVKEREQHGPIEDSKVLAEIVKEAIPARFRRQGGHPSRKVFQALRLAVNRELENISTFLPQALRKLVPGGRMAVIAYHSLEDRLVKLFFREHSGQCSCPPNLPCVCGQQAELKIITGKALKPLPAEVEDNPRARSARMRVAEKLKITERKWV
jgi:16S rRNA (cytosine1402-N4)-methyltransferase